MTGPDAEALLIQALKATPAVATLCGSRIGTRLGGTYPCVRVTLTGGVPTRVSGVKWLLLQWEAWGNGTDSRAETQAVDLGREIEAAVDTLPGVYVSGAIVSAWIEGPMSHSTDPTTSRERYLGSLGLIAR